VPARSGRTRVAVHSALSQARRIAPNRTPVLSRRIEQRNSSCGNSRKPSSAVGRSDQRSLATGPTCARPGNPIARGLSARKAGKAEQDGARTIKPFVAPDRI